ncbi:MAG: metallophosphoesterase [Clostridiales bacterium]|nr:metallophosphoesterase [Clostridiales bacterium]
MNYYIADPHFGHERIITLCSRPFKDADEMDRVMIERWNKAVTDKDDVYIIGDLCHRSLLKPSEYLRMLKGRKHLITGNHDDVIFKDPDALSMFESIDQMKTVKDNGKKIFLCHYPVAEWPGYFSGTCHFYGHIHNTKNKSYEIMKELDNAFNVGAELLDYTPRTADKIISLLI